PAGDLLSVDGWNPVVGPEEEVGTVIVMGCDTEDGEGMLVEGDDFAEDMWACGKTALPEVVAEHDVGSRAEAVLIRGVKEAAKSGLKAEYVEVVSGRGIPPVCGDRFVDADADAHDLVGKHSAERLTAVLIVAVVGIGFVLADLQEIFGMRHIERAQDD